MRKWSSGEAGSDSFMALRAGLWSLAKHLLDEFEVCIRIPVGVSPAPVQAPVPHVAMDRCCLERINAVNQFVLCAQIPHDILGPCFVAWLPGQTEAVPVHPTEKRREV